MDRTTARRIEDIIWDITVGSGIDPETCRSEPNDSDLQTLSSRLGRPLTFEDESRAVHFWKSCVRAAAQE